MEQKVRLAVVAHIRHCHTSYEKRLRDEVIKNGGQRAPAKVVQRIKSKIWGEVNAVVKRWQKTGAGERVIPQQNPHRRPAPPKTRWQQNVEQGFVITHPPINRPRPIFIRHEERRKAGKTETKIRQKRPVEVILIESDSEEDTATGADIPEIIDLQDDDEMEGGEIMEGNSNDWGAAVGNAQDWDIGEDDEGSDIDENCFFYPDEEEDVDYVERERGLGSDADKDDEEVVSDHDMDSHIVQEKSEEEEEEEEGDDDNIMAESDEPIKRDEAFLEKKEGEAVLAKQENDQTVSAPLNLEKAEVATEVDGAIFEPVKVENIVSEDETSMKEPHLENGLVINADEIILDLEDIKAVKDEDEIMKEEDEIMIDSISQIDVQSCSVSRVPEGGAAVEVAKSAAREEGSIRSMLEKAARMSKEEEEELRSAVEADEDEIYRDFGF
ncbi:hypothetical protein DFP73DRAFT_167717 [Morchella snyderi]|nr:hypothetical protein DFP73DRAFT_167717 [Morchella snyderi]